MLAQNLSLDDIQTVGFVDGAHYAITDTGHRIAITLRDYLRMLRGDEPMDAPFGLEIELPADTLEDYIEYKMTGRVG